MRQINWEDVQKDLESGLYFKSEVCKKYNIYYKLIRYAEEHNLLNSKLYNINTKMKEDTTIIEINGNQHYNSDGTLKEYYQVRHKYIKNLGWNIIELHYSLVYNKDIYKNIIEKIKNGKSIDLPFYIKNKKNKKYKNQKDYFNKMNEMYYKIQEQNIELILN